MTRTFKLLAAASGVAISALAGGTAHAAGTTAGSTIQNTVTVNYNVGGVAQTQRTASDTLTVDRKITLTVAASNTATTSVSPGQTQAATTFIVTNTSNEGLDFGLAVTQLAGGAAPNGGTDNFDVTAPTFYLDDGDGVFDSGDTLITFLDEIAADASRTVHVVGGVPGTQVNGDKSAVILTATAREGGTAATQGAVVTQTAGANTAAKDTVFADGAGSDDAARSGSFSARDDYTVAAALLTVAKTSRVIADGFNTAANAKMIPGATVEYCIAVTNATGGATATNVAISDPVPTNMTFVTGSIVLDATVAGGVCSGGTAGGSFASNTVSGTLTDIPSATTRGLRFQVTIN